MTKKLNIVNLGPTPPRLGGSAFANIETLVGLAQRGHDVRCISCLSPEHLRQVDFDASWRDTSVEVYPVELPFIPSSIPLSDATLFERGEKIRGVFYSLVDQVKPDVVMVGHESHAYYLNEEARELGIPVVQVLHGTPTHSIDEGIYPDPFKRRFLDAIGEATLAVGVSRYLSDILNRNGIPQTTYIYNGTDTNLFKPIDRKDPAFLRSLGVELGQTVVMHASNLKEVKRPLDIVDAAAETTKERDDLVYVIVGDGPLRDNMEVRVRRSGLSDSFRFVRRVSFKDMPRHFQHADMFLLPSEQEGFGRVIREAQACETVPVASNVGPLPEVINHGEDGLLFERGSARDLADKVLDLAESPERRRQMERNARVTAMADDVEAMLTKYETVLQNPESAVSGGSN